MGSVVSTILEPFTGAKATRDAANIAAARQEEAARLAALSSVFRPVGMTNRFGTSDFQYEVDPETGIPRVSSANYTVDPNLVRLQDRLLGFADYSTGPEAQQEALATMTGLRGAGMSALNLGQQYLATSPEAAKQQYMREQTALLDPVRQQEEQRLARSVFGRGRAGLSVGAQGQPELATLAQARRQQDLGLAAQAEQAAQQRAAFGTSLAGTGGNLVGQAYGIPSQALGPLSSYLGLTQSIEEMGRSPFQLGLNLGGMVTQGSTTGGNLLAQGMSQAAQSRYQGTAQMNAANSAFIQNMASAAMGSFGGGGGGGSMGFSPNLEWQYASNPFRSATGPFNSSGSFEV